jgi:uncharacterized membrane protein
MTLPTDDDALGTSTGLAPNVAGALAYVLGPITGIAFLILETKSRFVRFHAAQSTVVFVIVFALSVVLGVLGTALAFIPFLGWIVSVLLSLGLSTGSEVNARFARR